MPHSILHTVNQSPFTNKALEQCIHCYQKNDGILLLENGVYAALQSQPLALQMSNKACYAIAVDIKARGLSTQPLIEHITMIDYDDFVNLCTQHILVNSWY